jgi:AcrR family transcriptional regulator
MQLSRKRIIATAIKLIDAEGVAAVSMQRLATELGCGLLSLYSYVPSATALLDGVADEVMSGVAWTPPPGASSQDQARALLTAFGQIARAHPRCAMLALARHDVPASLMRPAEIALAKLREAGLSGADAARVVRVFATYMLGLLVRESGFAPGLTDCDGGEGVAPRPRGAEFPQLTELYLQLRTSDVDGDFEFGLGLLAHAITARAS